jgi:type VI secretion system protein ImpC
VSNERQPFRIELTTNVDGIAEQVAPSPVEQSADAPFRIGVIGDFTGRANRRLAEDIRGLAARRPVRVDRDTIDDVLAQLAPELHLPARERGAAHVIPFAELDDFHPDRLYERLPAFQALRDARGRAAQGTSVRLTGREPLTSRPTRGAATSGSLLDQILGDQPPPPTGAAGAPARTEPARTADGDALAEFVRRAVEPYVVHSDPASADLVAQVDAAVADQMRAILHHADFQALEAAWRAVDFLVRRLDADRSLRIELIDVSAAELAADALPQGGVGRGGFHRLIAGSSDGTPAAEPWAVLIGLFTFGPDPSELGTLRHLSCIARDVRAPLFAAADPRLVGSASFGSAPDVEDWADEDLPGWQALRRSECARYIALAAPRFLLRLPYGGRDGAPCDVPGFDELGSARRHEDYLWGNSAALCALLLGEAFNAAGWALRPGLDVGGLPLHVLRDRTEVSAKPCAEAILSDRAVARMLDRGVMAVQSLRNGDAVRLARFQSIANPLAAVAGRWAAS